MFQKAEAKKNGTSQAVVSDVVMESVKTNGVPKPVKRKSEDAEGCPQPKIKCEPESEIKQEAPEEDEEEREELPSEKKQKMEPEENEDDNETERCDKFCLRLQSARGSCHKRQRRTRQSVTAKREKSQTPKVLDAILT